MPRYTSFEVNGVLDTTQTVLDNLNTLATTVGCWITYDSLLGKWSTVINRPAQSEYSFDDTNIIGGVSVSGTGITELYNGVTVQFPNADLQDNTDYIDYTIPLADRNLNEQDNVLNIILNTVNNAPQAQYIGISELKQSRLDKIIQFKTDFSAIGLKAGTVIDVTLEMYGFDHKLFRIAKIIEDDADDGNIVLEITALEYSDDIYSSNGLVRKERNKKTGVVPKSMNTILTEQDGAGLGQKLWRKSFLTPYIYLNTDSAEEKIPLGYTVELPATGSYRLHYDVHWAFASLSDPVTGIQIYGPNIPFGHYKSSRIEIKVGGNTILAPLPPYPPGLASPLIVGSSVEEWGSSTSTQSVDIFFSGFQGQVLEMFCWVLSNWNSNYQNPSYVGAFNWQTPVGFTERSGVSFMATVELASELIGSA